MLTLYDLTRSGNCYKARLLLGLLAIEHKTHTVHLDRKEQMEPWFLALNPLHTLPVIDDEGTIVRDSAAVLVYVAAKHDAARTWYPADAKGMAEVQQWLAYSNNEILHNLAYTRGIALGLRQGDIEKARENAKGVLSHLDSSLRGRSWLATASPTIADVACYPYAAMIPQAGVALDAYPALKAWCGRIESLKGYVPLPTPPAAKS